MDQRIRETTGMKTAHIAGWSLPGRLRLAWGSALLLLALAAFPAPAPAEPPMWVLKDRDSTIYLFGTVHLLDPAITWQTPRVLGALEEAKQLWVEVNIPPGGELALGMAMLQKALSPGKPLSSRLDEAERARLRKLLERTPNGAAMGAVIETTRPWFATVMLGVAPLMAAGYDTEAGADTVLIRRAREKGIEIRGLETAEQQIDWLAGGTDEEQLVALKALLAMSEEELDAATRAMDDAVRAWMKGDIKPLTDYVEGMRTGEDAASGAMSYDVMITQRNEDWAGQLEAMLKGAGVAFVAVGGGHLVGPDSVQQKLAARGIQAGKF
jgi:uncharacterized protein YbaP (TraB family)